MFPYGWSWTEFEGKEEDDRVWYEEDALELSMGNVEPLETLDRAAVETAKKGKKYRADKARQLLQRYIARKEIRFYLGSRVFLRALRYGRGSQGRKLTETSTIEIMKEL
jgi:hypothetical protein